MFRRRRRARHDRLPDGWTNDMNITLPADRTEAQVVDLVTKVAERRPERWVCEPCFEDFATEFGWVLSTA